MDEFLDEIPEDILGGVSGIILGDNTEAINSGISKTIFGGIPKRKHEKISGEASKSSLRGALEGIIGAIPKDFFWDNQLIRELIFGGIPEIIVESTSVKVLGQFSLIILGEILEWFF